MQKYIFHSHLIACETEKKDSEAVLIESLKTKEENKRPQGHGQNCSFTMT